MGGTGVAQQLARFAITADQQAFAILGERARLAIGGEAGRTVGVIAGRTAIAQDQRVEEGAQRDEDEGIARMVRSTTLRANNQRKLRRRGYPAAARGDRKDDGGGKR